MNQKANLLVGIRSNQPFTKLSMLVIGTGMFISIALGGLNESGGSSLSTKPESYPNSPAGNPAPTATALKSPSANPKPASPDAQNLTGRSDREVEAALGKPTGKLQKARGALWLYAGWRIQLDQQGRVLQVEKDEPVKLARVDPQFVAASEALARGAAERAAADDLARARAAELQVENIRIISKKGQQVDLPSLLEEGKITIVDFYADWCGPCKRLSPHLEQLAKGDSEVVLLKIDMVDWESPVTKQFGIKSVPNVRVFNRAKAQIGGDTSNLDVVKELVIQARKSDAQ
jgi:thioredoxin 1